MTSIAHLSLALRENESLKADTATAQEPAKLELCNPLKVSDSAVCFLLAILAEDRKIRKKRERVKNFGILLF